MTQPPPSQPPAGWFPDPQDPSQQRWWNGEQWTDHTQSRVGPTPLFTQPRIDSSPAQRTPAASLYGARYPATYGTTRAKNSFASTALALAILAFPVLAFASHRWIAALDALVAVILGILAMRQSRTAGVGKKRGVWAIVLGAIMLPAAVLTGIPSFGAGLQSGLESARQPDPTVAALVISDVEADIKAGIKEQSGTTVKSVECPASPTIAEDASFECVAITKKKEHLLVEVRVQDNEGSYTWEVVR